MREVKARGDEEIMEEIMTLLIPGNSSGFITANLSNGPN